MCIFFAFVPDQATHKKLLFQFIIIVFKLFARQVWPLAQIHFIIVFFLNLCLPSSTFGTSAHSPDSTLAQTQLQCTLSFNPIVLHLWTQWHCLELIVNLHRIPIVNYTGELPALAFIIIDFSRRIFKCP